MVTEKVGKNGKRINYGLVGFNRGKEISEKSG
jgi:hypothetical protein